MESLTNVRYIPKYNLNVPSWDEVIQDINKSVEAKEIVKHVCPAFLVSHNSHRIPKIKNVLNDINCSESHTYVNLLASDIGFGRHKDTMDVWFWQAIGETEWYFDNGEVYHLVPGDMIEIPAGVYHRVVSKTPRCGISMSR